MSKKSSETGGRLSEHFRQLPSLYFIAICCFSLFISCTSQIQSTPQSREEKHDDGEMQIAVEKQIAFKMAKWYYSIITAPFTARFPVYTLPVGIRDKEECELLDVQTLSPLLPKLGGDGITIAKYIASANLVQELLPRRLPPNSLLWIDRPLDEATVDKHLHSVSRSNVGPEEIEAMGKCRERIIKQLLVRFSGLTTINGKANLSAQEIRKNWRRRLEEIVSDYNSLFRANVKEAMEESRKVDPLIEPKCEGLSLLNMFIANERPQRRFIQQDPSCDWYFFTKSTRYDLSLRMGLDHPPLFFNPKQTDGVVVWASHGTDESDVLDAYIRQNDTETNTAAWDIALAYGRIPLDSSVDALINNPAFKTSEKGGLQLPEDMKVAVTDMFESLKERLTPKQREKLMPYTIRYEWPDQSTVDVPDPYVLWAKANYTESKIDISSTLVRALFIHAIREKAPSFGESVYDLAIDRRASLDEKLKELADQYQAYLIQSYRQFRLSLLLPLGHEMAHIYLGNEGLFSDHEKCDLVAIEAINPIERGASLTVFTELMKKAYAEKELSLWFGVRSKEDWDRMLSRTNILTDFAMKSSQ